MMRIDAIDHFVLTVASIEKTCLFYERVLGMTVISFGEGRKALGFGSQKINLHPAGREFEPHAGRPVAGSADFCLITSLPLDECIAHVKAQGIEILLGPVDRSGATGKLRSFYFRDPDQNLVEVSNRIRDTAPSKP
jgi:catechol 2,3-dioxygenase-like lactoylglutathione lyase family enzyme